MGNSGERCFGVVGEEGKIDGCADDSALTSEAVNLWAALRCSGVGGELLLSLFRFAGRSSDGVTTCSSVSPYLASLRG